VSAAAIKHVDTCELSPEESLATNVHGVMNIIDAVRHRSDVECLLHVSTDKACEPVNVYGMCKALAERLVTSQSRGRHTECGPRHVCVRYGNVLESRGSIIPLFKWQVEHRDALTVTDPDMTRFVMTLDESVDLISTTLKHAEHGETWVPRIPSMRIGDLAQLFAERFDKKIERIDVRPGEKRHEDLVGRTESARTRGTPDFWPDPATWGISHYIILPATERLSHLVTQHKHLLIEQYTSNDEVMSKEALRERLESLGVLGRPLTEFRGSTIEEIRTT
jgi:UDP-glucose 4-epimerase